MAQLRLDNSETPAIERTLKRQLMVKTKELWPKGKCDRIWLETNDFIAPVPGTGMVRDPKIAL